MKKFLLSLTLLAAAAAVMPSYAQDATTPAVQEQQIDYADFNYQGFNIKVPAGCKIEMTSKEALLKSDDKTFGLSMKVEKDAKASGESAVQMCNRMIADLDIKGAQLNRLTNHGMNGARVQGTIEGAYINVVILDAGGKYVKLVIISAPEKASLAETIIDSITAD